MHELNEMFKGNLDDDTHFTLTITTHDLVAGLKERVMPWIALPFRRLGFGPTTADIAAEPLTK